MIEKLEAIDISSALSHTLYNRIDSLGIELEGGWSKPPVGCAIERDASVFAGKAKEGYLTGELPVGPIQLGQVPRAIRKYYPDLVDKTCGMHIHMHLEKLFYYALLSDSPAYQDTVLAYLTEWAKSEKLPPSHSLWPRLEGKNEFCQRKFWPQAQIQQTRKDYDKARHGHRYTAIHYCWERNRTVECRVLPMMSTPEQAIKAIQQVVNITNAYLMVMGKKKVKEDGKLEFTNGDVYEEIVEAKL